MTPKPVAVLTASVLLLCAAATAACTPGTPPPGGASASASASTATTGPTGGSTPAGPTATRTASASASSHRPPSAPLSDTLQVRGREILDTCGQPFVVRGVESFLGRGIDVDGSTARLAEEMGRSGSNAVRLVPNTDQLDVAEVDRLLAAATAAGMVVYLSPGKVEWFLRPGVKQMLDKHRRWLIIDAFQEPNYDDRARWQREATAAVQAVRGAGYTVPVTVLSNQFGRDLPALFERGPAVVAADPLHRTILGWQAYWGKGGFWQGHWQMSLTEGVDRAAAQPFPVQLGIDRFADPGDEMDYRAAMDAAQRKGTGWLWWDWFNPFGRTDNLSADGTAANLTPLGQEIVRDHPAGLRSARKACGR